MQQTKAEGTVTERAGKILMAMAPGIDWPAWKIASGAVITYVGSTYASMSTAQHAMFWAIGLDLLTGLACARRTRGGFRARKMFDGALAKFTAFAVVAYLSNQAMLVVEVQGVLLSIGAASAWWYTFTDWVSIVENLDELGAPLPPWVKPWLAKAKDAIAHATPPDLTKGAKG